MGWGIFKAYDFFKMFRTPKFLKAIFKNLSMILTKVFLAVGKGYIDNIQAEIIRASHDPISSKDKFKRVFDYAKKEAPRLKNSYINLLIESLVTQLKEGRII